MGCPFLLVLLRLKLLYQYPRPVSLPGRCRYRRRGWNMIDPSESCPCRRPACPDVADEDLAREGPPGFDGLRRGSRFVGFRSVVKNPHRGRFPGAVGSEETEDAPLLRSSSQECRGRDRPLRRFPSRQSPFFLILRRPSSRPSFLSRYREREAGPGFIILPWGNPVTRVKFCVSRDSNPADPRIG